MTRKTMLQQSDMSIDGRLEQKLGFDRVRKIISDRCSTSYAVEKTEKECFSTDRKTIVHRLQLTDEMRMILMFEENFPTTGYIDALPFLLALRREGSCLDLASLGKLRTLTDTTDRITGFFAGIKDSVYPKLKRLSAPVESFSEIRKRIDVILDKYGEIKDSASEALYDIRRQLREKENSISRRAAAILRKAQEEGLADSDASVSVRDGKHLIPVSSASKRKMPGFVYDTSATGKTTFIEPAEIIELENEVIELGFAQSREIARILSEFSDFIRPSLPGLIYAAGFMGEIDFLMAKAQTALDFIAGMPVISEGGVLTLRKARHPLLERALKKEGKEIVPLSLNLSRQKHIIMISGPNAGGKSVCLKTVGLLQYMFQWGLLIPTSETSELPVFDRICVSIGDDQSIDNDLSTYSSFLADMREMLAVATADSLVLIDEFGSGTEPTAGGSIAEAILAELDRRGTYGVITTHYTQLKLYASSAETGVVNAAMLFDAQNIQPLFRLEMGLPGNSFAFELARKMGLPEAIVKDAETRAGEEFVGIERNLRKIARNRRALDEKLEKIKNTDRTLESITDRYRKELEGIQQEKKGILEQARKEAEEIVRGANRQVENTIRSIKESQADKDETRQARKQLEAFVAGLGQYKEQKAKEKDEYIEERLRKMEERRQREQKRKAQRADERQRQEMEQAEEQRRRMEAFRNAPLKVGEKVRIKDNGMVGEVTKVSAKAVTLTVGNISTKLSSDRVERISSNEYKAAAKEFSHPPILKADESITARKLNFKMELDVRGQRLSDALDIVTHYIDDALMLRVPSVRIIHGKGTGVLRDEIQKYLKTVPGVASAADEHIQFGGSGVTVVTFD